MFDYIFDFVELEPEDELGDYKYFEDKKCTRTECSVTRRVNLNTVIGVWVVDSFETIGLYSEPNTTVEVGMKRDGKLVGYAAIMNLTTGAISEGQMGRFIGF